MDKNFEIEINSKHQLLDLNSDKINFDLNFKVESQTNDVFHALVLSKTELDGYQDLNDIQMKDAPGIIKGNIKSNDNKYENYFLILKKMDGSTKANVTIELEELEYDNNSNFSQLSNATDIGGKGENKFLKFYNDYFYHILLILFVVGIGVAYYNFVYQKTEDTMDKSSKKEKVTDNIPLPKPPLSTVVSLPVETKPPPTLPITTSTSTTSTSTTTTTPPTPSTPPITTMTTTKPIVDTTPKVDAVVPSQESINLPLVKDSTKTFIEPPSVTKNTVSSPGLTESAAIESIPNVLDVQQTVNSLPDKITNYLSELQNSN